MLGKLIFVLHVVVSAIALGTVAVSDLLHLKGLKNHKLEKKISLIYPYLSKIIFFALGAIILTGGILLYNDISILNSRFFQLKMLMVIIVLVNGLFLNYRLSPKLEKNVKKNHPKKSTKKLIFESSLFGSISLVTWFGIFVLAFTKDFGYSIFNFIFAYLIILIIAFFTSYFYQLNSHPYKKYK